ncbi:MAG: ribosome-associated translation inhibitor RaiA [Chloroflexi bacterium]|nr:ribosome-associated translation inhibitor RaiA [Chloroflexota bacterium]
MQPAQPDQPAIQPMITGRNIEVTPAIRDYVFKKLSVAERHLRDFPILAEIVVMTDEPTKDHEARFVAELTFDANGTLLRSEERARDVYQAIDKAAETMDKLIQRFRGRMVTQKRTLPHQQNRAGEKVIQAAATAQAGTTPAEEHPRIARVKRHLLKPMSVEEAVQQMDLLGHDFYVFVNCDSEDVNVVYRRKAGGYGLIEPELKG